MRSSAFDPVSAELLNKRLRSVTFLIVTIMAALILRLWFLQVVNGPMYRTQSESNRIHLQKIPPYRGMIFDRNGQLLVDNRPSYNLQVIPEDIQDSEQLLDSLEYLIGLKSALVKSKLRKSNNYPFNPVLLKKNISRDELAVIETNMFNLPGVMIQVKPQRNYIYGKLAAHLIGYLGEISEDQLKSGKYSDNGPGDLVGKYGVEARWQDYLNGLKGGMQLEVDAAGRKLQVISKKPPIPGLNISLTIDKELQLAAEKLLTGKKGSIVALNPENGEILAMASSPAFDPNMFITGFDSEEWNRMTSGKKYPLQNRAIQGQYPPGSVFKIIVGLAGLEEGLITPDEELYCNGSYTLGNRTYACWKKQGHGNVVFHKALRESCDVYFYKLGKRLGVDTIAKYAMMCGLGKKTGFDLAHEKEGLIPTSEWKQRRFGIPWQPGETISMSIGQSFVLVTPLQVARLISVIFNGGKIFQPKVVQWVRNDEDEIYRFSPKLMSTLNVHEENLDLIKKALIAVVNEPHGTGSKAKVKGITVAGKTGTSQIITLEAEESMGEEGEIPEEYKSHAWFVAIAPAENPKIAIATLWENGEHGSAAAPIAKELIEQYLKH